MSKIDANFFVVGSDGAVARCGWWWVWVGDVFPLVDMNDQLFAGCLCSAGFVTLCGYGFSWPLLGLGIFDINGEFDPGSGRTLAACLTHASRTVILRACSWVISGERVSNT